MTENNLSFSGLTIKIFEAVLEYLPYCLPHQFIPFNGSYDALVLQLVHPEKFDAVVGDVAITAERNQHAEFTYPYTESRLVMIVPVQTRNRAWLFLKPFTKSMWALTAIINIYNGFVIWLIERSHCSDLKGSVPNQIGVLLWLAFTTLFSLHGQKLHSNLSRMAMVMWLFVALVITQSYTANLASMLTVETLEPTVDDIESLKISKAVVGCSRGAFVANYLEKALGFHTDNIRRITAPEEYAQALRNGEIAAAFLEAPLAKLFLARYCKGFARAEPTLKVGGFGFVFPKGSPLLVDISEALLKVSESGKLKELENAMVASQKCVNMDWEEEDSASAPTASGCFS